MARPPPLLQRTIFLGLLIAGLGPGLSVEALAAAGPPTESSFGSSAIGNTPAPSASGRRNPLARLTRAWTRSTIVVAGGVTVGIPIVLHVEGSTALGFRKAAREDPLPSGPFLSLGGHLGPSGGHRYFSPRRALNGCEKVIGPLMSDNPIYGPRLGVGLFGVLGLAVSRRGGIELSCSAIRTPLLYPLVRGTVSVYVENPALIPVSEWMFDKLDQLQQKTEKYKAPVDRFLQRQKQQIARRLERPRRCLKNAVCWFNERPAGRFLQRQRQHLASRVAGSSLLSHLREKLAVPPAATTGEHPPTPGP